MPRAKKSSFHQAHDMHCPIQAAKSHSSLSRGGGPMDKEEAATPLRSVAPTFFDHNCGKGEGVRCILRRRASIKRRGEWDIVILRNHPLFLTHPRIAGPVRTLDGRSCRPRGAGCRRKSCNGSRPRAGESRRAPGMKKGGSNGKVTFRGKRVFRMQKVVVVKLPGS